MKKLLIAIAILLIGSPLYAIEFSWGNAKLVNHYSMSGATNYDSGFNRGVTFFADYSKQIDAISSLGNDTATFTATRGVSNPATWIDSNGVIQVTTTSNQPRLTKGFYGPTGFVSRPGVLIETAGKNTISSYSDGTSSSSGLVTGWALTETCAEASASVTKSVVEIPELCSISNAHSQRIQYTGEAGDSDSYMLIRSSSAYPYTGEGSYVSGETATISVYARTQTSITGAAWKLNIAVLDGNNQNCKTSTTTSTGYTSSDLSSSLSSDWKRFTFTQTLADEAAKNITAFADSATSPGVKTTVTIASHGWSDNGYVTIAGTTNYNGSYIISNKTANTIDITKAFVGNDATGTAQVKIAKCIARFNVNAISNGDIVDVEIACPQLEKNPYATSWIPTTTAALTRNAESLTYGTSGNRTAASESCVAKITPIGTFANDNIHRRILDSATKRRIISKLNTGTSIYAYPNASDNAGVGANGTTTPQSGTSYTIAGIFQHSSPYSNVYINGTLEGTYTLGDFTDPLWGSNFYVGSDSSGTTQFNGIISKVAIFNRALSASEVASVTNELSR